MKQAGISGLMNGVSQEGRFPKHRIKAARPTHVANIQGIHSLSQPETPETPALPELHGQLLSLQVSISLQHLQGLMA